MVVVRSRTTVMSMPCGMTALRNGNWRIDAIDGLNDVGAGLAEDDQNDGRLAVEVAGGADVLRGIDDVGDIGEADGGAIVVADDETARIPRRWRSGRW